MRTSDRPALSRPGRPAPVSAPAPAASVPGPAGPAFGLPAWDGPPVRLSLVPPDRGPVRIDGAWWPRSDDLAKELLPLLAALGVRWGRITHITVDAAAWQDGPRRWCSAVTPCG